MPSTTAVTCTTTSAWLTKSHTLTTLAERPWLIHGSTLVSYNCKYLAFIYLLLCKYTSLFIAAENSLDFAYLNTPEDSHRNRRLILMYLIPVKMQLGHMPNEQLLQQYELKQFLEVLPAVKFVYLRLFDFISEYH